MSAYERIAQLDPFDAANHSKLGRLKMQAGDARTAVREFRAAIAAGSLDPAAAHSDLAESYLALGDKVQARRAVLAAIEVAPGLSARAGTAAEGGRAMMRLRPSFVAGCCRCARCDGACAWLPAEERYALIVSGVSGQREVRGKPEDVGVVAAVDAAEAARVCRRSRHRAVRERRRRARSRIART